MITFIARIILLNGIMTKYLLISFIFTLPVILSQEVVGTWHGLLDVGQKLRLDIHISKSGDIYSGKLDSPDQGAKDIPATKVEFNNNKLIFEVKNLGVSYSGNLKNDSIDGTFKQGGFSTKLLLTRSVVELKAANRPQDPLGPFDYLEEEVSFENKFEKFNLFGTLTYPKGKGPFPAVILVSGSGPQDRNEEILGHKLFWIIADHLTNRGFAVLRYDDRGTAKSEGNFEKATSIELAHDAESALDYLKSNPKINSSKICVAGHSEGAMLAVMLAARRKEIHSIALLAGPGIQGGELLLLQQYLINKANGVPEKSNKAMQRFNRKIYKIAANQSNITDAKPILEKEIRKALKNTKDEDLPGYSSKEQLIQESINTICNPWMFYFIKYNPKKELEKINCHVLALNGSKDLQVPPKENLGALQKYIPKSEKIRVFRELPNLNHLFQECETGNPLEYGTIEQTIHPEVLIILGDWLKSIQSN
jgi:pimeloyl-ACP methyl ester carboxylesterase